MKVDQSVVSDISTDGLGSKHYLQQIICRTAPNFKDSFWEIVPKESC